jgi:hypothetical protein
LSLSFVTSIQSGCDPKCGNFAGLNLVASSNTLGSSFNDNGRFGVGAMLE